MNTAGEILFIEDDEEDRMLIDAIIKELGYPNKIVFLNNAQEALDYLPNCPAPFIIFSDINMPKMNGLQLREIIYNTPEMSEKCIPYIFLSTSDDERIVKEAFKRSVQGYFKKPNDYGEFKALLSKIIDYWKDSKTPA